MFATLGSIRFEFITSPDTFTATREYDYAEHKVVEAKPALQWIFDALEELKFEFKMHVAYTDPAAGLQALRDAASKHLILPLIYGNGYHRGKFVITVIKVEYQAMSDLGDLIYVIASVTLKEIVPDTPIDPQRPDFVPPALQEVLTTGGDAGGGQGTIQLLQPGVTPLLSSGGLPVSAGNFTDVPTSLITRAPA
jgi:phage protein U